ncbi:MAG: prepilin-type N-terminal cleavage/methylation domain-containing protein [Luteolibacter sp.]
MKLKPKSYRGDRAFTLVEMLVVIAIIAAIAAVSFMVVGRIRSSANAATSASNIRQLYVGNQLYLSEYNEFPGDSNWGSSIVQAENTVGCTSWYERIAPLIGLGSDLEQTQKLFVPGKIPPGILKVPGRNRVMGEKGDFRSGYARNPQINQNNMKLPPVSFKTLTPFSRPTATYFLIDIGGESPKTDYNGWEISKDARLKWPAHGGKPSTLSGNVVVCYMDGSVGSPKKGDLPSDYNDIFWKAPTE